MFIFPARVNIHLSKFSSQKKNPKELIERAKYDIELRKAGNVVQTSSELSPRDSHEDEEIIDDDFDDQSPSDDEAAIEFGVNAEEQNNELSDIT